MGRDDPGRHASQRLQQNPDIGLYSTPQPNPLSLTVTQIGTSLESVHYELFPASWCMTSPRLASFNIILPDSLPRLISPFGRYVFWPIVPRVSITHHYCMDGFPVSPPRPTLILPPLLIDTPCHAAWNTCHLLGRCWQDETRQRAVYWFRRRTFLPRYSYVQSYSLHTLRGLKLPISSSMVIRERP